MISFISQASSLPANFYLGSLTISHFKVAHSHFDAYRRERINYEYRPSSGCFAHRTSFPFGASRGLTPLLRTDTWLQSVFVRHPVNVREA